MAPAQEAPVPAKTFYGAVDPVISLKFLKSATAPKPTLKAAFTASTHSTSEGIRTAEVQQKKSAREKLCSGHFGCTNVAVCKETSGTLYCREHKPKHVPVEQIFVEKKKM